MMAAPKIRLSPEEYATYKSLNYEHTMIIRRYFGWLQASDERTRMRDGWATLPNGDIRRRSDWEPWPRQIGRLDSMFVDDAARLYDERNPSKAELKRREKEAAKRRWHKERAA